MKKTLFFFLSLCSCLFSSSFEEWSALEQSSAKPHKMGVLRLEKEHPIDQSTLLYVKLSLEHFIKEKVSFVVLDLDTPGGEVFSALKISELLKEMDSKHKIPVIAYVNPWAISAGAMLAYSCRYIGITQSASMGAAEPVMVDGEGGMSSASEKVNSALRAEFTNLANYWGRNPILAEAMVDKDMIVVMRDHKILALSEEAQIRRGDKNPDQVISAKGKLLTLNAKQMVELGVCDFENDNFFHSWVKDFERVSYENWKIDFFTFLTHPFVASLLTVALLLGIYLEVQNPGLAFPALIAFVALCLIVISRFSLYTIGILEPLLLILGAIFLALELFVFPGFGLLGILGTFLFFGGLTLLLLPHFNQIEFFPHWNLAAYGVFQQLMILLGVFTLAAIIIVLSFRKAAVRFALPGVQELPDLGLPAVGSKGITATILRPSGKVEIEGKMYDACADNRWIEKGVRIIVMRHESCQVYVLPEKQVP